MSGPVDVLAVLADYSAQHGDPEDFEQVRAAVAELIEAAGAVIEDHTDYSARIRVRAALARVQGVSA